MSSMPKASAALSRALIALLLPLLSSVWLLAQPRRTQTPEAIYYNGKVVTVDGASTIARAFAVGGGRFLAVGSDAEIRRLGGPGTTEVDLRGATVTPGFIDNHSHQYHVALLTFRGVDLNGVPSLAEMLARLRRAAAAGAAAGTVFTTTGWEPDALPEKRGPTLAELDAVSVDRPIVVYESRSRVHVNSAALKALGFTDATRTVSGVTAAASVLTGSPASVLNLTARIVPAPSLEEQKTILVKVQALQHAMGLTGIRDLQLHPDVMRAYFELWREHKITLRTSAGLELNAGEEDRLDAMLDPWGVGPGFGDEWLRLDGVAEYNPGEQMREPYLDRDGRDVGTLRLTPERFTQAILAINRHGWRPAIHVTGDRTLDVVLDAYEAADRERSIKDRRWVVEHIPIVQPDQIARMKRLGVVVSAQFQPYAGADGLLRRLGRERTERAVPLRELLDAGLVVSGGSDWPGAPNNPFVNIYYYVTRRTLSAGVVGAAQKISRMEALRVMTVNNAYGTFEERIKGSIEPGKLADFVVLSDDVLTVPEDRILSIKPTATYVGGRKVY
jgi:predicted amidohydrolase YtcJ